MSTSQHKHRHTNTHTLVKNNSSTNWSKGKKEAARSRPPTHHHAVPFPLPHMNHSESPVELKRKASVLWNGGCGGVCAVHADAAVSEAAHAKQRQEEHQQAVAGIHRHTQTSQHKHSRTGKRERKREGESLHQGQQTAMSDHASREVERRGSETGEMASERVMLCAITRVPLSNAKCCVCVHVCACVCVCDRQCSAHLSHPSSLPFALFPCVCSSCFLFTTTDLCPFLSLRFPFPKVAGW